MILLHIVVYVILAIGWVGLIYVFATPLDMWRRR